MGSSSYVARPAWNDQNDPVTPHRAHAEECESTVPARSLGRDMVAPLQLIRDSPPAARRRATTTLPAPVTAPMVPTESPSFLLSLWAASLFYCAEVTLAIYTILQRNHASGDRRAGLSGARPERALMHCRKELNWGGGQGERDKGEDGQPSQFSQNCGVSQDVELLGAEPHGPGHTWMTGHFRASDLREGDN